jgi:dTMP kinase
VITDDVATALRRAEHRDRKAYTTEQWDLHRRAAALFERLAQTDPCRAVIIDRRQLGPDDVVQRMADLITNTRAGCLPQPPDASGAASRLCQRRCRFAPIPAEKADTSTLA